MRFNEWVVEIARQYGKGITQAEIRAVLVLAFKSALEEFATNPLDAELYIPGIGRFYLVHKKVHYRQGLGGDESIGEMYRWVSEFKPCRNLKLLINGKIPMSDATVAGYYLYPEKHLNEEGKMTDSYHNPLKSLEHEIRYPNTYWYKKIHAIQDKKLRLTDDNKFERVHKIPKYVKPDMRGRPKKIMSPVEVRNQVMREMRRDLRRELRWLRQGKITEADLRIAVGKIPDVDWEGLIK